MFSGCEWFDRCHQARVERRLTKRSPGRVFAYEQLGYGKRLRWSRCWVRLPNKRSFYQSNESISWFNQKFDFVRNFLKVLAFNKAELFDDFVLVDGEKFVCLDE